MVLVSRVHMHVHTCTYTHARMYLTILSCVDVTMIINVPFADGTYIPQVHTTWKYIYCGYVLMIKASTSKEVVDY